MLKELRNHADAGLLIIRIIVGLSFMFIHGWGKLMGGVESWTGLGNMMGETVGLAFMPAVWGFLLAFAEVVGGLLILIGLLTRPAAILLALAMLFATLHHLLGGDGWSGSAHALKMFALFAGLIFVGPGKYSIDGEQLAPSDSNAV